jgi:hypothetical protein
MQISLCLSQHYCELSSNPQAHLCLTWGATDCAASALGRVALELEGEAAAEGRRSEEGAAGHILAPLSISERQIWRDKVGGSWKWSEVCTQA